jgi:hypothetical protein
MDNNQNESAWSRAHSTMNNMLYNWRVPYDQSPSQSPTTEDFSGDRVRIHQYEIENMDDRQVEAFVKRKLTKNIEYFIATGAEIRKLPALANLEHLIVLNCELCGILTMPKLPPRLEVLNCSRNYLKILPNLPTTLTYLSCNHNFLTEITNLPESLNTLICSDNRITHISDLPPTLKTFDCNTNVLKKLPDLPPNLSECNFQFNELEEYPYFPISLCNHNFCLNITRSSTFYYITNKTITIKYPLIKAIIDRTYRELAGDIGHGHMPGTTLQYFVNACLIVLDKYAYDPGVQVNPYYMYNGSYPEQTLPANIDISVRENAAAYCLINYINSVNYNTDNINPRKTNVALLNRGNMLTDTVNKSYAERVWHPRHMAPLLENSDLDVDEFNREREKFLGGRLRPRRRHTRRRHHKRRRSSSRIRTRAHARVSTRRKHRRN